MVNQFELMVVYQVDSTTLMSNNYLENYKLFAPLKNAIVQILKKIRTFSRRLISRILGKNNKIIIIVGKEQSIKSHSLKNFPLKFYIPDAIDEKIQTSKRVPITKLLSGNSILIDKKITGFSKFIYGLFENVFLVNNSHHAAAWEWIRLSTHFYSHEPDFDVAKLRLSEAIELAAGSNIYSCVHVFGTGPSLAKAADMEFEEGFKIVCNTIVRDEELFKKLKPNFIVAGDALYHFSFSEFACAFRYDLLRRLKESNTFFVYPAIFDVLVQRDFGEVSSQLIPVPIGAHKKIEINLLEEFSLPSLGNILPLLQLPLACTLSNKVFLWGFDGKSPNDNLNPFWANSNKHSYPELMHTLRTDFPGFFDHHVPKNNSSNYISSVHGDILDDCLKRAELQGFSFEMLHPSWTKTLNARYKGNLSAEEYFI